MTSPTHPFPAQAAEKRMIALRFWLQGKGYTKALRALDINQRMFTGVRKDGITPEFDHHVVQAQYMRTLLPHLLFPEETLTAIFFHDTPEDRGWAYEEIRSSYPEDAVFGERVAQATRRVTKKWRGLAYDENDLFQEMARCPIASMVKAGDRIHNLQSMVGVFNADKQRSYLQETESLILPMMKDAERRFPEQEAAYKNARTILKMQVDLIGHALSKG